MTLDKLANLTQTVSNDAAKAVHEAATDDREALALTLQFMSNHVDYLRDEIMALKGKLG